MSKNLDKMEELLNDCGTFLRQKDYVLSITETENIPLCDHTPENLVKVRAKVEELLKRFFECFLEDEDYSSLTSEIILTTMQALRDVYSIVEHHEDDDDDLNLKHLVVNVWQAINGCFILAFAIERGDTDLDTNMVNFLDKLLERLQKFGSRIDVYVSMKEKKSQRVPTTSFYALMRIGRMMIYEVKAHGKQK